MVVVFLSCLAAPAVEVARLRREREFPSIRRDVHHLAARLYRR
jgi:hypothetical protein